MTHQRSRTQRTRCPRRRRARCPSCSPRWRGGGRPCCSAAGRPGGPAGRPAGPGTDPQHSQDTEYRPADLTWDWAWAAASSSSRARTVFILGRSGGRAAHPAFIPYLALSLDRYSTRLYSAHVKWWITEYSKLHQYQH